jgi:hypothetical protein
MPFRNYPEFDLNTVKSMTEAYESVAARLQLQADDPRTGKLAIIIVQLVKAGVVDADRLADKAYAGLR